MNQGRVGEDRGSKETDGCPLTSNLCSQAGRLLRQFGMGGWEDVCTTSVLFVTHIRGSIGVSTSRHAKQL
jgi:hypothetical protein